MISMTDYRGRVVLVNFWASWSPPARADMPGFEKIFEEYEPKGFSIIGIALDDINMNLLADMRITYPVVKADKRVLLDYGNISDVPVSLLVGRDGSILKKVREYYPEEALRADVQKALSLKE
jgi:thiol-disulfide isomerase/thioredoxin